MLYLINEIPSYCPSCGEQHSAEKKRNMSSDFYAGASCECKCGVLYQYVPREAIIEASKLNKSGDLHRYA